METKSLHIKAGIMITRAIVTSSTTKMVHRSTSVKVERYQKGERMSGSCFGPEDKRHIQINTKQVVIIDGQADNV
jgi:hypothetical protein